MNIRKGMIRVKGLLPVNVRHLTANVIATFVLLLLSDVVLSADIDLEFAIEANLLYTDNVFLGSDLNRVSADIFQIRPSMSLNISTQTTTSAVEYVGEYNKYDLPGSENKYEQTLRAEMRYGLPENDFYLDTSISLRPHSPDAIGAIALDSIAISDNRTDLVTYSIAPIYQSQFDNAMNIELSYRVDVSDYEDTDRFDVLSRTGFFGLDNKVENKQTGLGFEINRQDLHFKTNPDQRFFSLIGDLEYSLSRETKFLFKLGYEDNEYPIDANAEKPQGYIVLTGFRWKPRRGALVELLYGDRYFGNTGSLIIETTRKNFAWNVTYKENPISAGGPAPEITLESDATISTDSLGGLIEERSVEGTIARRFDNIVTYERDANTFIFNYFVQERDFQESGDSVADYGSGITFSRSMARSMGFDLQWREETNEFRDGIRKDSIRFLAIVLSKAIQPEIIVSAEYRLTDRSSTVATAEYLVNTLVLSLRAGF